MSKQSDNDNHSNQRNPNNDEYWHSRGCYVLRDVGEIQRT